MVYYHVNNDGKTLRCDSPTRCPYGAFRSPEKAMTDYQERLKREYEVVPFSVSKMPGIIIDQKPDHKQVEAAAEQRVRLEVKYIKFAARYGEQAATKKFADESEVRLWHSGTAVKAGEDARTVPADQFESGDIVTVYANVPYNRRPILMTGRAVRSTGDDQKWAISAEAGYEYVIGDEAEMRLRVIGAVRDEKGEEFTSYHPVRAEVLHDLAKERVELRERIHDLPVSR